MSVVASELKAKFSADLVELEAGFKRAEGLQKQFVSQSSAIKVSPIGDTGETLASFKQLDVTVKATGEALSKYKFESTEAAQATAKLKAAQLENTQATIAGKNQIQALRQEKGELAVVTSQARLRMLEFKESQQQVHTSSGNLLKSLGSLKGILGAGAGLALVGFGKEAISSFTEFEGKLKEIQAVSSVTGEEMKKLSDRALELGEKFPTSATQAAGGFAELSKAGFTANEVLESSMGLLTLSTAGQLEMGRSAEILAGSIRGFGLAASDANHVVDLLAQTANQSAVSLSDMGDSFKYVAPAAQAAGFGMEDVSIALGLMGNSMIKGSEAGTSLRSMITGLTAPTQEGADALAGLGISVEGAGGKIKPFREIITELRGSFTTLSQADQIDFSKKIVGKEAMSGFLSVIRASDKDFAAMTDAIDHADGAAKKMSDTMSSGLGGKLTNLSGSLDTAKIKIGQSLSEPIGKVADAINAAIPGLTKFAQVLIEKVAPAAIEAAKLLKPIGDVLSGIGEGIDMLLPKVEDLNKEFADRGLSQQQQLIADSLKSGLASSSETIDQISSAYKSGAITQAEALQKMKMQARDAYEEYVSLNSTIQKGQAQGGNQPYIKVLEEMYNGFLKNTKAADEFTKKLEHPVYGGSEVKGFTDSLSGMTKDGLDPATDGMKRMAAASGTSLGEIKSLNDEVKRLGEAASTSSKEMSEASGQMKVMDDIALKLGPGVEDLWKQYKTFGEKAAEGGVGQDKWNTAAEDAKNKLIALNPKMADVVKAYDISKEKVRTSTDAFHDNTISMVLNQGQLTNVADAGGKAQASIKKTGDATADAAKAAKSHVGAWAAAGAASIDGFINAILAGTTRAGNAAGSVASAAASRTRQTLQIQSPSKVFEEIGQMMMKGWELGVDKNGDAVIATVAKTFSDVMGAVKTGVDAINSVSTFEGMNNAAANQFIFDSGNFITVFGEKGKEYSAKFLEGTSAYADGLSKGLGTIKGGVENLNSLATYGGMSNAVMNQYVQDGDNFLIVFAQKAAQHKVESLKSAEIYAESYGQVVATIKPGVEGLNALGTYVGYAQVNLNKFEEDSDNLMLAFTARAGKFAPKILEGTNLYAESFGKVVSVIAPGVTGMNSVAEYAGVVRTNLVLFADDADYAVTVFAAKAASANPELIKATALWAEGTGKIVGVIGTAVSAFKSVNESEYKRVSATVVLGIVEDVKMTADYMGIAAATMDEDVLKKTNAYSDMTGKVVTALKGSVDFFKALGTEDYSNVWMKVGTIVQGVEDTVDLLGVSAGKSDKDVLTSVTNYSVNLGKIFTPFKGIVDNLKSIADLKFNAEATFKPFIDGLDQSLLYLSTILYKSADYASLAGQASANMLEGGKALSSGASQLGAGAAPALPAPIPFGNAFGGGAASGASATGSGMSFVFQAGSITINGDSYEEEIRKVVQKIFEEEGQKYIDRQRSAGVQL